MALRTGIFLLVFGIMATNSASAAVTSRYLEYKHGGAAMQGYLSTPGGKGPYPAVMVVQDWNGIDEHEVTVCRRLAALGYVAFAVDIYGKGIRPKNAEECRTEATKYYSDSSLYHERLRAGLDTLRGMKNVDAKRMAAIGYCFGGSGVLEMARNNMPVLGVVSFHGGLTPLTKGTDPIKPEVIVLTGGADPVVPDKMVAECRDELRARQAEYKLVSYAGAGHGFAVVKGPSYQEAAEKSSWSEMKTALAKWFGK